MQIIRSKMYEMGGLVYEMQMFGIVLHGVAL